jgi:hypothetical protein
MKIGVIGASAVGGSPHRIKDRRLRTIAPADRHAWKNPGQ